MNSPGVVGNEALKRERSEMQFCLASTVVAAAIAGSALAGIPTMQISVSSSNGSSGTASPIGTANGNPDQYSYTATINQPGFLSNFSLIAADTSVAGREVLGGSIQLINTSSSVQTFTIDFAASTLAQGTSSLTGGSVSGVLTGSSDGGLFASAGSSIWSAYIRTGATTTTIASLLASPYSVTALPDQVSSIPGEAFGTPIPSQPSIAMGDAAGIRMVFQLGAGDQVDLSTVFVIQAIPAPGAVAGLALVGAGMRRRRRN
jgi:hypothetical protein